jgi:hypothetical protein
MTFCPRTFCLRTFCPGHFVSRRLVWVPYYLLLLLLLLLKFQIRAYRVDLAGLILYPDLGKVRLPVLAVVDHVGILPHWRRYRRRCSLAQQRGCWGGDNAVQRRQCPRVAPLQKDGGVVGAGEVGDEGTGRAHNVGEEGELGAGQALVLPGEGLQPHPVLRPRICRTGQSIALKGQSHETFRHIFRLKRFVLFRIARAE